MKISDGLQVEMFKVAAIACAAALTFYLIRKSYVSTVNSLGNAIDNIASAPSRAWAATTDAVGNAWQSTKDAAQQVADTVIKNEPLTPQQSRNLPYDESTGMVWGP
jgi:hypothetical protein